MRKGRHVLTPRTRASTCQNLEKWLAQHVYEGVADDEYLMQAVRHQP